MTSPNSNLEQTNSRLFTLTNSFVIPNAALDLADMGAAEHQHTESGLTDTAANSEG